MGMLVQSGLQLTGRGEMRGGRKFWDGRSLHDCAAYRRIRGTGVVLVIGDAISLRTQGMRILIGFDRDMTTFLARLSPLLRI